MNPVPDVLSGKQGPVATGPARRRILLVDDHPMMRAGMTLLINHNPDLEVCGEAGTASEALQRAAEMRPDLDSGHK